MQKILIALGIVLIFIAVLIGVARYRFLSGAEEIEAQVISDEEVLSLNGRAITSLHKPTLLFYIDGTPVKYSPSASVFSRGTSFKENEKISVLYNPKMHPSTHVKATFWDVFIGALAAGILAVLCGWHGRRLNI